MRVAVAPNGPELSNIVAGMWRLADWQLNIQARIRFIEEALALGISSFDHADIYGDYRCEQLFGEALKVAPHLKAQIQLVSKCGIKLTSDNHPYQLNHYDTSAAYVRAQVDASLANLGVEQLDLLLIHRPDYLMDAAALAGTFRELQKEGKVAHFGVSNHSAAQFALLDDQFPLVTNQLELSVLEHQSLDDGTLSQCQSKCIRPMAWSPLGGGRLFSGQDPAALRVRAVLEDLAKEYSCSLATIAYAWILRHPSRPLPITGSGRIAALKEATAALEVRLSNEQWYRLWVACRGHDVP
ncbi:aldo/keto reductase [Gallaecimonas pentaromativorans]|uniref:Putative oxidoreductase n=1 Tax=Gallaecimonas pentaromativorans TaxID=584787 RepID=A0A3N1PKK5_9GAMM|nr:aldo/keto reductase [Gallaecimonas pentaromativorans]ROQ27487.1 putative oxidoreductase [Gallaecimonas pentaromativorans]